MRVKVVFAIPATEERRKAFTDALRKFAQSIDECELAGKYIHAPLICPNSEIMIQGGENVIIDMKE